MYSFGLAKLAAYVQMLPNLQDALVHGMGTGTGTEYCT